MCRKIAFQKGKMVVSCAIDLWQTAQPRSNSVHFHLSRCPVTNPIWSYDQQWLGSRSGLNTTTLDNQITPVHICRVNVVFVVFSRVERGHQTTATTARKKRVMVCLKRAKERRRMTPVLQSLGIILRPRHVWLKEYGNIYTWSSFGMKIERFPPRTG